MSRKIIIIFSVSCLIFLALALGIAANFISNGYLAEVLSRQLGGQSVVTIAEIKPTLLHGVSLKGIAVKEQGKTILKAKEVNLQVDFLAAVKRPSSWMQALIGIDIVEPEIWLQRQNDGQWNVAELLPKKKGEGKLPADLQPKISFKQGKINLIDEQKQIKNLQMTDVSGQALLHDNPQISFKMSGLEGKMPLKITGKVDLTKKKIEATINLQDLDLALWRDFLPLPEKVQIKDGIVKADLVLAGYYPHGLTYSGKVSLAEGKVYLPSLQASFKKIRAEAKVTKEKIKISRLDFELGQSKLKTKGEVDLSDKVQADLNVEFKKIVWSDLFNLAPLKKHRASWQPYVSGEAKGKIHVLYDGQKVVLPEIALQMYQGQISGKGSYGLKEKNFRADLETKGIDLREFELPVKQGKVDLKLSLTGKEKELIYAAAEVIGKNLSWEGVPFNYVAGEVILDRGNLWINNLLLDSPYLKGRVSGRKDDVWQANINHLDLDFWTKKYHSKIPIQGTASFLGTVKQNGRKIEVTGDLFANRGQIMGQQFKVISGRMTLADNQLFLDNVSLKNELSQYSLAGKVNLNQEKSADLTLQLANVDLKPWLQYFSADIPLTGGVSGKITVKGQLNNPEVKSDLQLVQASYADEEIEQGRLRFSYANKKLNLDQLEIWQDETRLLVTGKMQNDREGQFLLSCTDLDLATIPYLSNKLLPGSRKGNLYGIIKVNNGGHGLILQDIVLEHGENRYSANGGILLSKNPTLNLTVKIENSSVNLLSSLMPTSIPNNFTGRIAGEIKLWGRLKAPFVQGDLAIIDGKIGVHSLGKADTSFVWNNETLRIVKMIIPVDEGVLLLKGMVQPDKLIDLELAGKNIKADVVRELYNLPEEVGGDFSFNIQVSGKTKNPQANGYIEVLNGQVRQVSFDRLTALLSLSDKKVTVQSAMLEKNKYKLNGTGMFALDKKGKIDLTLSMKEGDLGLLAVFGSKQIESASGDASAWLNVSGTWLKPYIKGEITVSDGIIKPKFFKEAITNLSTQIVIEQNTVMLNYLTGSLGGGEILASGKAEKLFTPEAKLDFALKTNQLHPKTPIFNGKITSDLQLKGSLASPLLQGTIFLEKGKAHIPAVFSTGEGIKCPLKLDLDLTIKDNLEVSHMLFLMKLRGSLTAQGTVEKPELSGSLGVKKGTINYLGTKFNVLKGDIIFSPSAGLMPEVKIGSKTRVGQNTIYLLAKGNVSDLEVEFLSDPPMSKNEIITLLTLGQKMSEGETELNINSSLFRLVGQSLSAGFLQGIEEDIGDTLGLDEFHLNSNLSGSPQLMLGKALFNDKLYVTYTLNTRLIEVDDNSQKDEEEWFLEARYKLPRNMNLTYTCNDLGESKIMLLKTFRF